MIKIVLIDDEIIALEELEYIIKLYDETISIEGMFTNPLEAVKFVKTLKPDIIFLDIEMPEINGFMLLKEIQKILPYTHFVFVTAYNEYAVNAFAVNAIDYILKPVSKKRIENTLNKFVKFYKNNKPMLQNKIDTIDIGRPYRVDFNRVTVWENEAMIVLNPKDILYMEASYGKANVVTEKKQYETKLSLNKWEEKLINCNFFRCHKSFLINLDKIEKVIPMFNNTLLIELINHSKEIPVSRSMTKNLKDILGI